MLSKFDIIKISDLNSKNSKVLNRLFELPIPKNLEWKEIESLLIAIGAERIEGSGSRVKFVLREVVATFHRPHPEKEAKPYQVKDARSFIEKAGVLL